MGWLHAPYKINKDDVSKSRYKRLSDRDIEAPELKMPDVDSHDYVLEMFYETGMIMNGAHGAVPITWTELRNYSDQSGNVLTPWESSMVMKLSRAYCSAYHDGQDAAALPPYMPDDEDSIAKQRASVSNALASMGVQMKESKSKPTKKPKPA
jgi:hypothetical protein